jgi:hypothetical protein
MDEEPKYYVKEIVKPNYLTGKVEREKFKKPKEKGKKKPKKIKKILRKPQASIKKINPGRFLTRGQPQSRLVSKGKTGQFAREVAREIKWLS